jgi:hypothetical protein
MLRFLDELNVTPLGDGSNWRVNRRFRFWSATLNRMVEVPDHFIVDFASTPRALWAVYPPWGRYGAAAVLHDWLYWSQECTRAEADLVLREAMDTLGVEPGDVTAIYDGVHLFGQGAWDHNAALKANGYTRMASNDPNPPYASAA